MEELQNTLQDPQALPAAPTNEPLRSCVRTAVQAYFVDLNGHHAGDLYRMVIGEVEQPLLDAVMRYARGNQTRAAEILGLNRSTLRKKLKQYGLD